MDVVKGICDEVAIISDSHLIEQGKWPGSSAMQRPSWPRISSTPPSTWKLPQRYQDRMSAEQVPGSYPLVKLGFTGTTVGFAALISEASRRFNIDISILSADIEYAGGVKFGFLLAELFGTRPSARPPSSSSSTTTFSWR